MNLLVKPEEINLNRYIYTLDIEGNMYLVDFTNRDIIIIGFDIDH